MMNNNQNFCMGNFKFLNLVHQEGFIISNSERMRESRLEEQFLAPQEINKLIN